MINKNTVEKEDVLYYVQARTQRNRASYSTNKIFDASEVESLRKLAINFVNKAKDIIDASGQI